MRSGCTAFAIALFALSASARALAPESPAASAPPKPTPGKAGATSGAPTEEEVKQANNPVASIASFNLQNYYCS